MRTVIALLFCASLAHGQWASKPHIGAEGFGAIGNYAGMGQDRNPDTVYHVTSTNDTYPNGLMGEFRYGMEQMTGYGTVAIVFDVSGIIDGTGNDDITWAVDSVSIFGQTAPGRGVALIGCGIKAQNSRKQIDLGFLTVVTGDAGYQYQTGGSSGIEVTTYGNGTPPDNVPERRLSTSGANAFAGLAIGDWVKDEAYNSPTYTNGDEALSGNAPIGSIVSFASDATLSGNTCISNCDTLYLNKETESSTTATMTFFRDTTTTGQIESPDERRNVSFFAANNRNIYVRNVTAAYGVDINFSAGGTTSNPVDSVTWDRVLSLPPLDVSYHPEGIKSGAKSLNFQNLYGDAGSVLRSFFMSARQRQPRMMGGKNGNSPDYELINNVFYNWGVTNGAAPEELGAAMETANSKAHAWYNYYDFRGPLSSSATRWLYMPNAQPDSVYLLGWSWTGLISPKVQANGLATTNQGKMPATAWSHLTDTARVYWEIPQQAGATPYNNPPFVTAHLDSFRNQQGSYARTPVTYPSATDFPSASQEFVVVSNPGGVHHTDADGDWSNFDWQMYVLAERRMRWPDRFR